MVLFDDINNDILSCIINYLDITDIINIEKQDKSVYNRFINNDFIFKNYARKNYSRIVNNISPSWYDMCKRISKNNYKCLFCEQDMGIGPIISLISYLNEPNTMCIPNFHISCIQNYKTSPRYRYGRHERREITTYICPLTRELVFGFSRLNI